MIGPSSRRRAARLIAAALLATGLAVANGQAQDSSGPPGVDTLSPEGAVREAMALAGIDEQVKLVAEAAVAQVEQRRDRMPGDLADWLSLNLADVFSAERMRDAVAQEMVRTYDTAHMVAVLEWLRSPLGLRLTAMELESSGDDAQEKVNAYAETLNDNPPSHARMDLVTRMSTATEAVEAGVEAITLLTLPMIYALNAVSAPESRAPADAITDMMEQVRQRIRDPLAEQVVLRALYTYRDVSDEELERYVTFLESGAGRNLYAGYNVGLLGGMFAASQEIGERLAEWADKQTPKKQA